MVGTVTVLDWLRRLRVRSAWGRSLHHRFIGKLLSMPHMIAMKCDLKVWMALSA